MTPDLQGRRRPGMREVIQWVVGTLVKLARQNGYATIRITVQKGQIEFVHLEQAWKLDCGLPVADDQAPGILAGGPPA